MLTPEQRKAIATKAAAASAKVRGANAKKKRTPSHPITIDKEQHKAFIHAIGQSCVGIVGRDSVVIGTGTLVEAGDRLAILTAEHVIHGCGAADLRFFLPKSGGQIADAPLQSLRNLQPDQVVPGLALPFESIHKDAVLILPYSSLRMR
jgi:hypothetical protein